MGLLGGLGDGLVEIGRGHHVHLPAHPVVAETAVLGARDLEVAALAVGVNQMSMVMPGIASCFTRKLGRKKLWMTSIDRTCTRTGRSFGR